jgi:uncharacterized protein YkwD
MNSALLTICFPVLFTNEAHVFTRIEKVYTKNNVKGIELANNYIQRNKSIASPYFFKLNHELEAVENNEVSLLNRTTHLSNALTFGQKFEQLATNEFEQKINWDLKKEELKEATTALLKHIDKRYASKTKLIVTKLKKLYPSFDYTTEKTVIATIETPNKSEITEKNAPELSKKPSTNSSVLDFNLLPTGMENIPSANKQEEVKIIGLINAERKKKGLKALVIDEDLCRAARYHASDLANQGYFDHNTHNVKNNKMTKELGTFERIGRFYKGFANTENIAGGNGTAEGAYQQWFHSEGHHKNMLNESANKVGIGFIANENSPFTYYWVFCTAVE